MIDSLDNLESLAKDDRAAFPASTIRELCAEVRRLRERLEIDSRHPYDGIDCRDETIRVQDEEIAGLRGGNERLAAQFAELEAVARDAIAKAEHWKANHDNQVARARFLIERGDIPLERVRAYEEMAALQAFRDFFRDRCEGLFAQFGMTAVDAYNEAERKE